ncbi:MAG: hypothetical protein DRR42_20875, partial [Gammaproteobacteria bacterium]
MEGLSSNETTVVGDEAEDIADLILYFGQGDTFSTCSALQTLQFKYKTTTVPATSSYLKKTIQKFADTVQDFEKEFSEGTVENKLSFAFVTNGEFSDHLWGAIKCLQAGTEPAEKKAKEQFDYLEQWCNERKIDAHRLFSLTEFRASTRSLAAQNRSLRQTVSDWSAGVDSRAKARLFGLVELIREKAGLEGQCNNLVKREDVLDALDCEPEDLFPADTRFIDVGEIVERTALGNAAQTIKGSSQPVFIYADGGVGKTVFIQSLAMHFESEFVVVVFDCFGGGSYRSDDQARHLPRIGLVQISNELASRGLCDPLLPTDSDRYGLIKAARKRLIQASQTVNKRSGMKGVLIVLDAADNAQIEADNRNEVAFPKLLLASLSNEPIEGVKLVLTSRSHRMETVIGASEVVRFELGPFTEPETSAFLETRRPSTSSLELSTAIERSRGNARVLEYLVGSWDLNVAGTATTTEISVEELIEQKCEKIFKDLHVAGWSDSEVKEFFAAISLLPPPIPLDELANALEWSRPQVNSAASDLAPMLELVTHGVIFRDEPTETYIIETYSNEIDAQQAIAQRLQDSQVSSMYAAEALPHFLIVINDSDRAFKLASSSGFPKSIQSEYGRRRLRLARLYAAFTLAVRDTDFDRVLSLSMQLSQVASANAKGDQFIRRSISLATILGDRDASRRLFNDRSGWRGARDSRLTVAYGFLGENEEANIHQNRAIGWINWYYQNEKDDDPVNRSGPDASDFAAVVFLSILNDEYVRADQNLANWNLRFALSVAKTVVSLCEQHEALTGSSLLQELAAFASSKKCHSIAMQVSLLSSQCRLTSKQLKGVARAASTLTQKTVSASSDQSYDHEKSLQAAVAQAAVAAIISNSRQSSARILSLSEQEKPLRYDYGDRHGTGRAWIPVLSSCVGAWAKDEHVTYHHLLPREVKVTRKAKAVDSEKTLMSFLEELVVVQPKKRGKKDKKSGCKEQFNRTECEDISKGIELVLNLVRPLETAILSRAPITKSCVKQFLSVWESSLRIGIHWRDRQVRENLARNVGMGLLKLFLQFSQDITKDDAQKLVDLVCNQQFTVQDKLNILALIVQRSCLHDLAGAFAQKISDDICKDEYIEQRGENYSGLAAALVMMSTAEAREYYKQGLSQLDQMGGDDY